MIQFPWTIATAPNFLLEITTGCNVQCRGCYKIKGAALRPLTDIEHDLETGLKLRRAQTVSIAGAEPTLHPQLPEVVKMVRRRGLRAALLTNGLLLTERLLSDLKTAGLDVAMLHIDEGQQRSDLPPSPTLEDVNALRLKIAGRLAAHGIDAGLCATIYPETVENIPALVRLVLESEALGFLFASHYVDVHALVRDLRRHQQPKSDNRQVVDLLQKTFRLEPFAEATPERPFHWLSYFIPVSYSARRPPRPIALESGVLDSVLLSLPRYLTGRNLFYTPNSVGLALAQVLLNRAAARDLREVLRLLRELLQGDRLRVKRLIFDNGLKLTPEGKLDCLEFCPNSTVRNGVLVPICLSDYAEQLNLTSS